MTRHPFCCFNAALIKTQDLHLDPFDLGFNRGYAIFDYFRCINGKFRFLDAHLDRFIYSAQASGIPLDYSRSTLIEMLQLQRQKNECNNAWFRMTLTRGRSMNFSIPDSKPTLLILSGDFVNPPESNFTNGVKLISKRYTREQATIKTTNYFFALKHQQEMLEKNAVDILYYDEFVTETSRANFFIVKGKKIYTAGNQILEGITRKNILQKYPEILIENFPLSELNQCDEAFITSSSKTIMPVVKIDDITIGNGEVGSISKALKKDYDKMV